MTKKELVKAVALETECTYKDINRILDAILANITTGLIEEGEVAIPGFGKFAKKHVAEKNARNPRTGAQIVSPAYTKVTFKYYEGLKKAVQ